MISGTLYAETVSLQQLLPPHVGRQLWGKKITLGAWIWADKPAAIRSPILHLRNEQDMLFNVIDVSQTPGFYQFEYRVPEGDGHIWLSLTPLTGLVEQDLTVYYDGIVLVDDSMSAGVPAFSGVEGQNGVWGNQPFTNLLRNASAENTWPRFRPWFEKLGSKLAPYGYSPSTLLYSFIDEAVIRSYYWNVTQTLLRSFWAKFGWAHVPLYGHRQHPGHGVPAAEGLTPLTSGLAAIQGHVPPDRAATA